MNNEMQQQGNKSAAALSLATMLSESLMKEGIPQMEEEMPGEVGEEMPMEQEEPQEVEEPTEETEEKPEEDEKDKKIADLENQIGDLETDIELIKKAITNDDK